MNLGSRVRIFWVEKNKYYLGTVTKKRLTRFGGFSKKANKTMCFVEYDNGVYEWIDMAVGRLATPTAAKNAARAKRDAKKTAYRRPRKKRKKKIQSNNSGTPTNTTTDPGMVGLVFDSPTNPKFETITTKWVKELDPYKNLQAHLVTTRYNSTLPIASDVTNFDHTQILNILHFPGDKDAQKLIEEGLLWRSKNGFIGECCLSYIYSKFATLATLLGITSERREVYL